MMLAILLLATVPLELPTTDYIDALEHNHFFDQCGKPVFQQAIAWRWNQSTSRYEVQAWWLIKHPHDAPSRDMLRFDGPMMRRVQTDRVFRSWTQFDPELLERKQLPVELRRGMRTFLEVD